MDKVQKPINSEYSFNCISTLHGAMHKTRLHYPVSRERESERDEYITLNRLDNPQWALVEHEI
jgi:hypothetical protein